MHFRCFPLSPFSLMNVFSIYQWCWSMHKDKNVSLEKSHKYRTIHQSELQLCTLQGNWLLQQNSAYRLAHVHSVTLPPLAYQVPYTIYWEKTKIKHTIKMGGKGNSPPPPPKKKHQKKTHRTTTMKPVQIFTLKSKGNSKQTPMQRKRKKVQNSHRHAVSNSSVCVEPCWKRTKYIGVEGHNPPVKRKKRREKEMQRKDAHTTHIIKTKTMLRHWSQLVPNMSADIWGH